MTNREDYRGQGVSRLHTCKCLGETICDKEKRGIIQVAWIGGGFTKHIAQTNRRKLMGFVLFLFTKKTVIGDCRDMTKRSGRNAKEETKEQRFATLEVLQLTPFSSATRRYFLKKVNTNYHQRQGEKEIPQLLSIKNRDPCLHSDLNQA
jgi:hypothetical protein